MFFNINVTNKTAVVLVWLWALTLLTRENHGTVMGQINQVFCGCVASFKPLCIIIPVLTLLRELTLADLALSFTGVKLGFPLLEETNGLLDPCNITNQILLAAWYTQLVVNILWKSKEKHSITKFTDLFVNLTSGKQFKR